ncbi:hypothetical protein HJC23_006152 [Cyclotella cryptica]|uniref:Glycosyltransferase 61 catalytic domain-containing protein n=1 Tax=Cyclotella cryptica TaxID=29204 RepID=A0ABD3PC58_9STRA|eukprot:CCRYP_016137-RA/>CCRYP_016137-RA protein AED:0.12 eAED:0.12 QI:0/-1/0/1/-1/1/1/0/859
MSASSRNLEVTNASPLGPTASRGRRFYVISFLILLVGFIYLKLDSWEIVQWNGDNSLLRGYREIKLALSQQTIDERESPPPRGANETDFSAIPEATKSPSLSPTKSPTLLPTKSTSSTTTLAPNASTHRCHGITPLPQSSTNQTTKYIIWYPRSGMGNVLVSYTSASIYSCLTGRILKIAPYATRENDVFDCPAYYDDSYDGSICHDLEMDRELTRRYESWKGRILSPEAWALDHCPKRRQDLEYFLCDDGLSEEEFIAVNSCQYWGDLFFANPYLKGRLSNRVFSEMLRDRLRPSVPVREKMVRDGPYHVCIHVRWDYGTTAKSLGEDWIENLGTCVRNLFDRQDDNGAKREVLLFTMHEDVRQAVRGSLENSSSGGEQHKVRFASEVSPAGGGGHSSDKYQGVADMFSMGQQCVHLLPSMKTSTYFLIGANLMDNLSVFPGEEWKNGCLEGSGLTQLNPVGDFWSDSMSGDVCKIRDVQCKVKEDLQTQVNATISVSKNADVSAEVSSGEDSSINSFATTSEPDPEPIHDDKCKRMFEWSMLDRWKSDGKDFDFNNLPQTKRLDITRMGGPSAVGSLTMRIEVRNRALNLTAVDTTKGMKDLKSPNVWHRYTALYGTWVGVQIATRKYHLLTNRTVYVHDCNGDMPLEWLDLGEISCDRNLIHDADVVIVPPVDGLMWDLAWDFDFQCENSEMFKAFASLFVDKSAKLDPTDAMGCWISREGATYGTVTNLDDVLNMMREVFPRVKVLEFNAKLTTHENVEMLRECRVLFGNHGAGHTNAIYARPGVSVVEIIGKSKPAYYRNINMLLNQNYESIIGDPTREISDPDFTVNLDEARAALIRGRDHAAAWIEKHGYWR